METFDYKVNRHFLFTQYFGFSRVKNPCVWTGIFFTVLLSTYIFQLERLRNITYLLTALLVIDN